MTTITSFVVYYNNEKGATEQEVFANKRDAIKFAKSFPSEVQVFESREKEIYPVFKRNKRKVKMIS